MLIPIYSPTVQFQTGFMAVIVDGQTTPTGWLHCDGTTVSRTTYSALNTIMSGAGYPYGSGDGSTTFHLPDEDSLFCWEVVGDVQNFKLIIKT